MTENKKNIKKQQIIDAAIEVIQEKTVEEATVREIAAKAGLTTGAIYHHYKNKDELLYDVINQSLHFTHRISVIKESTMKTQDELLKEIQDNVALRLSKHREQKLHILLLSDVISKDGDMKKKYETNYEKIIERVADLYFYAFGVENAGLKKTVSSILVAALDGAAIQTSLGVLPESEEKYIKTFVDFFSECVPMYLKKHIADSK